MEKRPSWQVAGSQPAVKARFIRAGRSQSAAPNGDRHIVRWQVAQPNGRESLLLLPVAIAVSQVRARHPIDRSRARVPRCSVSSSPNHHRPQTDGDQSEPHHPEDPEHTPCHHSTAGFERSASPRQQVPPGLTSVPTAGLH